MRRRKSGPKHSKSGSSALTIVLLLVLGAAFIYTYQALDINSILFKTASTSASSTLSPSSAVPSGSATPGISPSASMQAGNTPSGTAAPSGGKLTEEIKMSGVTLYCVQIGAFSKLENAQAFADTSKKQGSAGYIMKDDALYRVFDSVYYIEADADAIRDSLRGGASPDACVINVKSSGLDWKVSATREQIDTIKATFATIQLQTLSMINIQKTAQQDASTAGIYAAAAGSCAQALSDASKAMMQAVGQTKSSVILNLNDCLNHFADTVGKLSQNGAADGNAFLSGLKYNIIDFLLTLQNRVMG